MCATRERRRWRAGSTLETPLSVVYATKPEFFGEVDKELSARLGFNYKLSKLGAL
jgi:hypothetical protein